ncbi:MAG TPA: hypothetical protein VFS08_14770 [Gemmatimonadaceae bacterium]|nr:hypothetical protein [Gemmatimonadaceae bacterium]
MPELFPPLLHGTLREHYLLLFGAAAGIALVVGLVSAWVGAAIGARRAVRRAMREASEAHLALEQARLAELGRGIEAVALEVERIAEAQRYTARLLTERMPRLPGTLPPSATARTPDAITPH